MSFSQTRQRRGDRHRARAGARTLRRRLLTVVGRLAELEVVRRAQPVRVDRAVQRRAAAVDRRTAGRGARRRGRRRRGAGGSERLVGADRRAARVRRDHAVVVGRPRGQPRQVRSHGHVGGPRAGGRERALLPVGGRRPVLERVARQLALRVDRPRERCLRVGDAGRVTGGRAGRAGREGRPRHQRDRDRQQRSRRDAKRSESPHVLLPPDSSSAYGGPQPGTGGRVAGAANALTACVSAARHGGTGRGRLCSRAVAADAEIRPATRDDVPLLLELIGALADYERLRGELHATAGAAGARRARRGRARLRAARVVGARLERPGARVLPRHRRAPAVRVGPAPARRGGAGGGGRGTPRTLTPPHSPHGERRRERLRSGA